MKKVAFCTLGCKVNQYESQAMGELFTAAGYTVVPYESEADVYIINTCSVTSLADRKSRQMIRRAKKQNPDAYVVVTGCFAQTAPEKVSEIEGVNLVVGTSGRNKIVELVEQAENARIAVEDIMQAHEFEPLSVSGYSEHTRAFIKAQEGCSQFCSYCIIPYARGPVRSRPQVEIIEEANRLAAHGYEEIVLVGIHIASYGRDLKEDTSLQTLITEIEKIDGIRRIRLSSIEPMHLNEAFIETVKNSKKLCRHFHISLQSGCDATLRRMNRKYTSADYARIAAGLRSAFEDVAITTDVMVGFPGETEKEFNASLEFVKDMQFAEAHVFAYSVRGGTPAQKMPNQVAPEVKHTRSARMIEVSAQSQKAFLKRFVGRTLEVLFEQPVSGKDNVYEGKTDNYITVLAETDTSVANQFHMVEIQRVEGMQLYGRIVR
ncbi:MAG: tRNA (N(6)-L-threonylcarbamoyladenosine(37)-C(2))-methylthiotransferase MtaB [Clostridia bacterium]|nr:tRNA (N(6)-L-threonylcarbamoyladenosine(37)-C(2))-methylthiotransferase MtaB [Clostridia bacterium]